MLLHFANGMRRRRERDGVFLVPQRGYDSGHCLHRSSFRIEVAMAHAGRYGRFTHPLLALAGVCATLSLAGCVGDPGKYGEEDKEIPVEYSGLAGKSVAIVVYADDATTWEYARAREEVSAFVAQALRVGIPTIRLVDYHDVLQWQDATLNWYGLPIKDIGKHFDVDRVIYIELLQYSSREPGTTDLLRGSVKANCSVYETDSAGDKPAWSGTIAAEFPEKGPEDPLKSNDLIVRKRALETFAGTLTQHFVQVKDKS
jgi:hypothetical protein